MKIYYLLFALLFTTTLSAQQLPDSWQLSSDGHRLLAGGENESGFYNPAVIRDVRLTFEQDNWWQILEANYTSGTDLLATCFIDGVRYDSVGVRFKGETSFRRNNTEKKSFNITLDAVIDGQDVEGYNTFNLNCGWEDNSSMREVLYNNVGHNYYMSLKANYANLEINGENWGPYQSVQQFDSDYIREWYLSNDGTIWRATSSRDTGGGGPGGPGGPGGGNRFGAGTSTLNYNGPDTSDYTQDYVLRRTERDNPWADLIEAVDVLNNEPLSTLEEALASVLDIDKACWFLAQENVWADDDGYINKGGSDYFVYYEAETGRIVPMEYDGNSVLGNVAINWSPFYRQDDTDFPLINRMLAVPAIRQRYLAHVRVILSDYFTPENTEEKIDAYTALIDELVQEDPKKFYTYTQFQAAISDLKSDVISRRNLLLSNTEIQNGASLSVGGVSYAVGGVEYQRPSPTETVDVVAHVGGSEDVASVWLYHGGGLSGPFDRVEMFDDGAHNDGAAGDGQYGGTIPALSGATIGRYYIEAVANDAANTVTYEPKGAEHDVFIYQVDNTSALAGDLVINEFMASNDATQADQDGEFDDWIELYNNTDAAIDLTGFSLSDDSEELDKYTFPAGTAIGANDYLIVWADGDTEQDGLHAGFGLSAGGETLLLTDASLAIIDSISYTDQEADISHGRFPNGTGDFTDMNPTFNAENSEGIDDGGGELEDSPLAGDLVVNELMASNETTQADQDGEFDDWIELYNNTNTAILLDGFHLSDDPDEPTKWAFPAGTTIAANDYLIIWADGDVDQAGLHADFGLSGGGESVLIIDADTALIDQIDYPEQTDDISYGRFPNGIGDFADMTPTFNAENNDGIVSTRYPDLVGAELTLYPNPARETFNIKLEQAYVNDLVLKLYGADGRLHFSGVIAQGGTSYAVNVSDLPKGLYLLAVADGRATQTLRVVVDR